MNGVDSKITNLANRYESLEKEIQKLIYHTCSNYCRKCELRCCKEEICRESIESPFLSMLIEKQRAKYDIQNGWISSSGCRLAYGRPLVCYRFFCEDILKSHIFNVLNIKKIINDFVSVGNKAHGNTHLVCIDNLKMMSPIKIEKMIYKITLVMNEIANMSLYRIGYKTANR